MINKESNKRGRIGFDSLTAPTDGVDVDFKSKNSEKNISLLDDFSEEKEVDGNLEEVVFKNFESEINEEKLDEDIDFLNKVNKANAYANDYSNNQDNKLEITEEIKESKTSEKPKLGRTFRPYQIGVYVTEISKDRIDLISKKEGKKKADIIEKLLEDYQKKNWPNQKIENKREWWSLI